MWRHRGNDLVLSIFTTWRLQQKLIVSLTFLSVHVLSTTMTTTITNPYKMIALGHIYTYMTFRLFTNIASVGLL